MADMATTTAFMTSGARIKLFGSYEDISKVLSEDEPRWLEVKKERGGSMMVNVSQIEYIQDTKYVRGASDG